MFQLIKTRQGRLLGVSITTGTGRETRRKGASDPPAKTHTLCSIRRQCFCKAHPPNPNPPTCQEYSRMPVLNVPSLLYKFSLITFHYTTALVS